MQSPDGAISRVRLTSDAYLRIVAATNFKQRARKMLEYHYADQYVYAVAGRTDEAMKIIKDLEGRPSRPASTHAHIALIYVGLGDRDQAMSWLNKAYEARFNPSILMRPAFDPIRSDALRNR